MRQKPADRTVAEGLRLRADTESASSEAMLEVPAAT